MRTHITSLTHLNLSTPHHVRIRYNKEDPRDVEQRRVANLGKASNEIGDRVVRTSQPHSSTGDDLGRVKNAEKIATVNEQVRLRRACQDMFSYLREY